MIYKMNKKSILAIERIITYITELEMFINWKGWLLRDYPQLEEWNNTVENFGKVWEKMHDYNCNKFDYGTEEGKYYFQTID